MNHQTTTTREVPANEDGNRNLSGFEVTCTCGLVMRNTVRSNVEQDAREHLAWSQKVGR